MCLIFDFKVVTYLINLEDVVYFLFLEILSFFWDEDVFILMVIGNLFDKEVRLYSLCN